MPKEFVEKGADLEHQRWARWQKWCHKVLRENCPSPKLEKVLERWDKQIATPYSKLSEKEKESDRKETRNYLPLIRQLLAQLKQKWVEDLKQGKICLSCGAKKESNLIDFCSKCLEEN